MEAVLSRPRSLQTLWLHQNPLSKPAADTLRLKKDKMAGLRVDPVNDTAPPEQVYADAGGGIRPVPSPAGLSLRSA